MADERDREAFTEAPEHKDMQDHRFGMTAAREQEEAERVGRDTDGEETAEEWLPQDRPEPHAGGRA